MLSMCVSACIKSHLLALKTKKIILAAVKAYPFANQKFLKNQVGKRRHPKYYIHLQYIACCQKKSYPNALVWYSA